MFQDIHLSSILHFPVKEGGPIKVVRWGVDMMNMVTSCLLSSWLDFYQGAVRVWRGWPRSRARADLIRICDRFNVSLRKSDRQPTSEQVADGDGESGRMARTGQGSTIPRTP